MKTLISLFMLALITVASIVSCKLFMKYHYDISALLTIISFISVSLCVYVLSNKKIRLS